MAYLDDLRKAIKRLHGCESKHVRSVEVHERFEGKTVWQGLVEVFDLDGHSKARRCYAWAHSEEKDDVGIRYVAVLELTPVDSAQKAVQVSIASDMRQRK